jgi:plastocyanin
MPSWEITIRKGAGGKITFDPDPLNAQTSDLVIFRNEDDEPHLLGTAHDPKYFMPNPVAPGNASPNFVVSETGQTLTYVDYDIGKNKPKPNAASGTIDVAATYQIAINKTALGSTQYEYSPPKQKPNTLLTITVGASVSWMNNDDVPHWPGIAGYANYFMAQPIPPGTSSLDQGTWTADPNVSNQTLTYVDTLDQSANPPTAKIEIKPLPETK